MLGCYSAAQSAGALRENRCACTWIGSFHMPLIGMWIFKWLYYSSALLSLILFFVLIAPFLAVHIVTMFTNLCEPSHCTSMGVWLDYLFGKNLKPESAFSCKWESGGVENKTTDWFYAYMRTLRLIFSLWTHTHTYTVFTHSLFFYSIWVNTVNLSAARLLALHIFSTLELAHQAVSLAWAEWRLPHYYKYTPDSFTQSDTLTEWHTEGHTETHVHS